MSTKKMLLTLAGLMIIASLLLASCAPAAPEPEKDDTFKVGLLHPSPVTDAWSGLAYQALLRIESELGAEIANVEIKSPAEREKAMIDFASQGYDLVIGHDFAMQDAVLKVAPDYPNTFFSITGGTQSLENYSPINLIPGYRQALYATGLVAGKISKTGKAAAFTMELPATRLPLEGFCDGFKDSVPGNSCAIVIIDGRDVGAAKEAALQAISGGVDILIPNANIAGDGIYQAAAESEGKAFAIGTIGDQTTKAPNSILLNATLNVPEALFNYAKSVKEGTMEGNKIRDFTITDENVFNFVFNPDTADIFTDEMKAMLEDTIKKLQTGEIDYK